MSRCTRSRAPMCSFRLACLMLTSPVAAAFGLAPALISAPRSAARLRPRRSGGALVMKVRVGIIGLPNVGKSTLFNALARKSLAQAANFPFCTIEPNVARLGVPDAQLGERLQAFAGVERHVSATIEWVGIAGRSLAVAVTVTVAVIALALALAVSLAVAGGLDLALTRWTSPG